MGFHQPFRDVEAQAGAFGLADASDAVEALEDMGQIIWGDPDKAFRTSQAQEVRPKVVIPLALGGGFFDAIGGGGWGPIVTTNLVALGHCPRATVGSMNAAEFFVTMVQVATFVISIGIVMWQVSVGLLIGGVLAAPLAALICKRLPRKAMMILVGLLICIVSAINIYKALT